MPNPEISQMCECLAAWVDTEPCICGELPGAPAELDTNNLARATTLARQIKEMDYHLKKLKPGQHYHDVLVTYGQGENSLRLRMPDDMIAGVVRTMRRHRMIELAQTGVTSGAVGHRPVLK